MWRHREPRRCVEASAQPHQEITSRLVEHTSLRRNDRVQKGQRSGARDAVRHLGRGLLIPRCPAAALDRRQRALPAMQNVTTKVRRNRERLQLLGEAEKTKALWNGRALVFETCGRLGGAEGTKLLRDLVATAANGQCSPHAVGRWRGPSWNECC